MTKISVITPSFRQVEWLRLAVKSIADQRKNGFELEHIVQDSCSNDGTAEFLKSQPELRAIIEKDTGMYDAVNRGLRRSTGDIVSYLNCDEQYLPGALDRVVQYFDQHPEVDMLFAGLIVVNGQGEYVCSRKVLPPLEMHTRLCHLSTFTCSTFFRRRIFEGLELFFDPSWKAVGDAEWMLRCLKRDVKMASIPDFTSVFADMESNLGTSAEAEHERNHLRDSGAAWMRSMAPLVAAHHRLRRWIGGIYRQSPFSYAIYTLKKPDFRTTFTVPSPTTLWKKRFTLLR